MSSSLTLHAIYKEAPGALHRIFGPDGTHSEVPYWLPPLRYQGWWVCLHNWYDTGHVWIQTSKFLTVGMEEVSLDLLVHSIAAHLGAICHRAILHSGTELDTPTFDLINRAVWAPSRLYPWEPEHAAALARLVLTHAAKIAELP